MVEAKKAAFKFEKFQIPNFSFNDTGKPNTNLAIAFDPKGKYYQNDGKFEVEFDLTATDDVSKMAVLNIKCIAIFKFEDNLPFVEIPDFFYTNSIAIVFPYIRAFVSTLTLQANTGLILLSTMNLTNLNSTLKQNSIVISK